MDLNRSGLRGVPALAGDDGEAAGAEAVTTNKDELLEGREGLGEEGQIVVGDRHALQVHLLEPGVGGGHGVHPGREVGPPVQRHQVEVGEPGPALDGHSLDPREPGRGSTWRY
jgi:hypothetical protein